MPPLYYAPCIVFGATRFYLPPWVDASITRSQKVERHTPPQTNQTIITSVRPALGAQISLTVSGVKKDEQTQASVLKWYEDIWFYLSGEDKTFDFYIFSDRAWTGCALEDQTERIGLEPLIVLTDTGLTIFCPNSKPDTSKQLIFTDYNTEYPYASLVGRPLGDAVVPGTESPIMEPSRQVMSGHFPGAVEAPVTTPKQFIVGGTPGSQWLVKDLQLIGAETAFPSTGTTTVILSTAATSGAGQEISAAIGPDEFVGTPGYGSIQVTAGDTLYVFIPDAPGGHQDLQFSFSLQAI